MDEAQKPWWADDPALDAIRRGVLEELERAEREPIASDGPDPVHDHLLSGASW